MPGIDWPSAAARAASILGGKPGHVDGVAQAGRNVNGENLAGTLGRQPLVEFGERADARRRGRRMLLKVPQSRVELLA
jgi:hypothetical protein